MDFIDQVKAFAATVPSKLESIKTEEAAKNFLVMPFVQQILGYDVFNPAEFMPEFDANVGAADKFKIDYAIFKSGEPVILIECKCPSAKQDNEKEWSQLYHYFSATHARIGILTNGVVYKFYADLIKPNLMDKIPFLVLDLIEINNAKVSESAIEELKKLAKNTFDLDEAIVAALRLKYVGGIKSLLRQQLDQPNEDFVKFFFKDLCPDNIFTGKLKDEFSGYTKLALREFIKGQIDLLLRPLAPEPESSEAETRATTDELIEPSEKTGFTEDEREGYYIVKSILSQTILPERVTYKDTQSYCNVLLDDNSWKPIVRLHFNSANNRKLELFQIDENGDKKSEKSPLDKVSDIYKYSEQIKSAVVAYESK